MTKMRDLRERSDDKDSRLERKGGDSRERVDGDGQKASPRSTFKERREWGKGQMVEVRFGVCLRWVFYESKTFYRKTTRW